MNKVFLIASTVLLQFSLLHGQSPNTYQITGKIAGLKDGDKVVMKMMVYKPGEAVEVPMDSAVVKNGQFVIKGSVAEGPRIYWMHFGELDKICRLYIDNGQDMKLVLNEDINKIPHQLLDHFFECTGSPTNNAFHVIWGIDDMLSQAQSPVMKELSRVRDSLGYDKEQVSRLMNIRRGIREGLNIRFLYKIESDILPAAPLLALYQSDSHDHGWVDVYNQLDEHLKNSVLGKKLKNRIPLLEGQKMPDFSLPDPAGKTINLKNLIPNGKLTLVRFWASKSFLRKDFDNELRAMYKQYHDKGFNIIAVSSDSFEEQWKETLGKEQYPWINVFDKKGSTVVDAVYHEYGNSERPNTTNVLVDREGKIIAWDPFGIELQYYIDLYTK